MIKFIHFSDSHLGFSDLELIDDEGKNIREEDVYNSFSQAVDIILAEKPDFVIHTGDLFHRQRPTNRTLITAHDQISRIAGSGIPFYMIAGNHDYPKTVLTPAIHELYKLGENITIANEERLKIVENENWTLHLLPHINSEAGFIEEVRRISVIRNGKPNILATHLSIGSYLMEEFGERIFPSEYIGMLKDFDYVALGHWHKFQRLKEYGNTYYSGATERTSETQTGHQMGLVRVTIDGSTKVEFIPLKLRTYKLIDIQDCAKKENDDIYKEINTSINGTEIKDGIFRVNLNGLEQAQAYELTKESFSKIFNGALDFRITKKLKESNETIIIDSESFDLKSGFLEELSSALKGDEFDKMKKHFELLWNEIEEEEADANS